MKYPFYLFLFIIMCFSVYGSNNIYEFDEKTDIIITTSVYKSGIPFSNATCNLTIFNPPPNETIINLSVLMDDKGNGIYSYDLTGSLDYNNEIYPITLHCNDSSGFVGADDRVGIKVGERLYDFIIGGAILIAIAFLFIYISFKIDNELVGTKLIFFYIGLAFVLSSLFYAIGTVEQIPNGGSLKIIFSTLIVIFSIIMILLMYLQFTDKLQSAVNTLLGSK